MKEKVLESEIITDEQPQEEAAEEKETKEEIRPEVEGILEIQEDNNFGFLRFSNFLTSDKDIYVSPTQIRRQDKRYNQAPKGGRTLWSASLCSYR